MFVFDPIYRKPFWSPDGEGGSGGGAPVNASGDAGAASGDGQTGQEDGGSPVLVPPKPGADSKEGDADASADGEQSKDNAADGDKPGDGETSEPLTYEVPDEYKDFQGDVDTFLGEANDWLTSNPDATPADALKWAMERQAGLAVNAGNQAVEQFEAQRSAWKNETETNSTLKGPDYKENLAIARKGLDAFGSEALKTALDESGFGDHPAWVEFAFSVGKAIQDGPVVSPKTAQAAQPFASRIYPAKQG